MSFIAGPSTSELSLLSCACELSYSVHSTTGCDAPIYLRTVRDSTVFYAFRGSHDPRLFVSTATKYGECQINNIGFLQWMKNGNNQPASVHQGALTQFLHIWNNLPGVQEEACLDYETGKTVVFTGHSIGGAIASLATLFMLDKQLQSGKPKSFFCVTFGFPLMGDDIMARAVRRKRWADQFCHVVLRQDVFSRILLAPTLSVCEPLESLFPYWKRALESVGDIMGSTDTPMEETLPEGITADFVRTIVQHCSAVVNYSSAAKMSPNNALIAAVKPLVKLSPYRPFGRYVFCSKTGGVWIENHFAVLPILCFALQTSDAKSEYFILEHVDYNRILPNALQNIMKLEELSNLPLSDAGSRMATQLDELGLGIQNCQARLSLRAAGQALKQQRENVSNLEEEYPQKMEKPLKKLEEYRLQCLRNEIGCYDAFKRKQRRDLDFQANLSRLELAGWLDEIIQNKFEKDELPDDFQCSEEWIRRGTHYRLLVEPLDIANYYRLGKNEDSGPYFTNGRPRRYKVLQKFLEDNEESKQLQPPPIGTDQAKMLTQDSCLWAFVEEISCSLQANTHDDALINSKCKQLEERLEPLIMSNGLCMEEFLVGESTFKVVVKWVWARMSQQQRTSSPFSIIAKHLKLTE